MSGTRAARVAAILLGAVWLGFWFWAFSFAYSNSFFRYDLCSRVPPLVGALFVAGVIPVSAVSVWRRRRTLLGGLLRHSLTVTASFIPFAATAFILARVPGTCRLSADDAMGVGIDFLVLIAVAVSSVVVLGAALAIRKSR